MKQRKKFFTSVGAAMTLMVLSAQSALANGLNKDEIYTNSTGSSQLDNAGKTLLQIVGGSGATIFALAFMVIGLFLAFGSLNPQKSAILWRAFFVCGGAAFVFFMAYALPAMFKSLAG